MSNRAPGAARAAQGCLVGLKCALAQEVAVASTGPQVGAAAGGVDREASGGACLPGVSGRPGAGCPVAGWPRPAPGFAGCSLEGSRSGPRHGATGRGLAHTFGSSPAATRFRPGLMQGLGPHPRVSAGRVLVTR